MGLDHLKRHPPIELITTQGAKIPPQGGSSTAPPKTKPENVMVKFKCGHAVQVAILNGKQCSGCIHKQHMEEVNNVIKDRKKKKKRRKSTNFGRLPAGSIKTLTWDGAVWNGILSIPDGSNYLAFRATEGNEAKCLHGLHNQYSKFLEEKASANPPAS